MSIIITNMSSNSDNEDFSTDCDSDITESEDNLDDLNEILEDLQIQPYQFEPEKERT